MPRRPACNDCPLTVTVTDGFWGRLIDRNRAATLPHVLRQCEASGYIRNLDIAAGRLNETHCGGSHEDSDVFKTVEGLCYSLGQRTDPVLQTKLDELIPRIAEAQAPDGYFNSHYRSHKELRRYSDLHRSHELYVAGHLIEAAVAHFQVTGRRPLLDVALKLADHLDATFGPGRLEKVPGHQELELALIRLWAATGEQRYLRLARFFVDTRGTEVARREYAGKLILEGDRNPGRNRPPEYRQDHLPATEQRKPVGHAVRACYFYAAMTDIAMANASEAHARAVDAIWEEIVARHLYITGGIGTHQHRDEGFGDDYLLPNDTAYCETCGGIALLLFSYRMGLLKKDARYADIMETILYNHVLASTDLAGVNFNYRNPPASDGTRRRHAWPNPACCPTNIVRTIPQISRFAYGSDGDAVYIDQFISSVANLILDGGKLQITQETGYPWNGRIRLAVSPESPLEFALNIRIPGWLNGRPVPSDLYHSTCERGKATVTINGQPLNQPVGSKGYCVIRRTWRLGDRVDLEFQMPIQRVYAHPKVEANKGRVALTRGPLLYCLEEIDLGADPSAFILSKSATLKAEHRPDLLGGVTVLTAREPSMTAVPFFVWNNRQPGRMQVWIKEH